MLSPKKSVSYIYVYILNYFVLFFVQPVLITGFNSCVAYTTLMCLFRHRSNNIEVDYIVVRGDSTKIMRERYEEEFDENPHDTKLEHSTYA